jgi:3-oxoacyl-[acyl-carrier-protein] synthase I
MKPLLVKNFTATSCIGRGLAQTLESLSAERSGLSVCRFETVDLDTRIGEALGGRTASIRR